MTFKTVEEYLDNVDEDRRPILIQLRKTIRNNLPEGFEEVMAGSMPGYVVPLSTYPAGYHVGKDTPLPFVSFASQKSHIALYHFGMYVDKALLEWFEHAYAEQVEHKLDMGKSCVRFKRPESIPFDLIAELMRQRSVQDWVDYYESMRPDSR